MDYSLFDSMLDSVFVLDSQKQIIYCNQIAADLCESSVRRMTKGKTIADFLEVEDSNHVMMPNGTNGFDAPTPLTEYNYKNKSGKAGRFQVSSQPFKGADGQPHWAIIIRDVTLEEVLHGKYRAELEQKEQYIIELQKAQKALEDYSKNLEVKVAERTAELQKINQMLSAIMNSLGQGFLTFDASGMCSNIYTKACKDILETEPAGQHIWDVFRLNDKDRNQFEMWMKGVFGNLLPFDAMKDLGPKHYSHSLNRYVTLDYYPIQNEAETLESLVVVATDNTAEHLANIALEKERHHAKMILKMVSSRKQFMQFLSSTEQLIDEANGALQNVDGQAFDHDHFFRVLHTIEGEAGAFSVLEIRQAARGCQEVMEPLRSGEVKDVKQILPQMNRSVRDLAICFEKFKADHMTIFMILGVGANPKIEIELADIVKVVKDLKEMGASDQMCATLESALFQQPVGDLFRHFEDVIETVASKQGKKMERLQIKNGEIKINPEAYEDLMSAMVHVFRNAVDHGIETPEDRMAGGKPEAGKISIDFEQKIEDGKKWLRIQIMDDGNGIDPQRIRKKLGEKYPQEDFSKLSDHAVIQEILRPGFSSRDTVGEFSGRGVGMDAVKVEVLKLGGSIKINSTLGKGTHIEVRIPILQNKKTLGSIYGSAA